MKKTTKDDDWIDINIELPTNKTFKKFHVKMVVGSMTTKVVESVILGRTYATGFRFMTGDWQRVTHWKPFEEPGSSS